METMHCYFKMTIPGNDAVNVHCRHFLNNAHTTVKKQTNKQTEIDLTHDGANTEFHPFSGTNTEIHPLSVTNTNHKMNAACTEYS